MSEAACLRSSDAGAYVLGSLEDFEAEAFRDHLAGCADCQREVAELQPVVDMLPVSAPADSAPPHLRDRIMAVVNSEAELLHAAGHEADRPPAPVRRPRRWWVGVPGALAGAAALAAGVVIGAGAFDGGPATHVTRAVVAATGSSAVLRQSGGRGELDVSHLSQAPAGRVYEVWLQRPHRAVTPTDALFVVDRAGNAVVAVPGSLHGVQRVMVTAEPVGGSSFPTTGPVITVPLAT